MLFYYVCYNLIGDKINMENKTIKHKNIIYVKNIHEIGGVETFAYELAKKYQDKDIAVVCKTVAYNQKERLEQFCRVYIHKDEKIECDVIITNWDTSILEYVNKDAKKYTVLHTDYSNKEELLGLPKDNEEITYIGITEDSKKKFENITGIKRTILCRNPLSIEEDKPILKIVSATRLTKIKDNGRLAKLAEALERQGIDYIWYIFTTDEYKTNPIWSHRNVIFMKSRLELGSFFKEADWCVQLSSCEGDSYSLKEALYRGTPVVVCELPYFKEIGIKDGENALFYNIDNSNADEVASKMKTPLKFTFKQILDGYDKIIVESKSKYKEEKKMQVKVKVIKNFYDMEEKKQRRVGEEYTTNKIRAEYLGEHEAVEIIEEKKNELKNSEDVIEEKLDNVSELPKEKPKRRTKKSE